MFATKVIFQNFILKVNEFAMDILKKQRFHKKFSKDFFSKFNIFVLSLNCIFYSYFLTIKTIDIFILLFILKKEFFFTT